jgi:hypothetical protein
MKLGRRNSFFGESGAFTGIGVQAGFEAVATLLRVPRVV